MRKWKKESAYNAKKSPQCFHHGQLGEGDWEAASRNPLMMLLASGYTTNSNG